ncbi:hypothetical protein ATCC90586_001341 [Pythium insidiosum]|nr:hypothetical protein ATCC90586_001341 [Pythium insidiosum]
MPRTSDRQPLRRPSSPTYATFASSAPEVIGRRDVRHPLDDASAAARVLLSWVTPLMRGGHRQPLGADDLWPLRDELRAERNAQQFRAQFDASQQSIPRAFLRCFGLRFALTGLGFLVAMLCNLVGPVVLQHVVAALTSQDFSLESVAYWVLLLLVAQVVQALVDNAANLDSELLAIQLVACLKSLVFDKALRLSAASRRCKSTGEIANLFTADSDAILQAAYLVHQVWLIPLQIAIVSTLLYRVLGAAAFAGIGVILALLVVNNLVSRRMFHLQRAYRRSKDSRMKRVTEAFKAISIVKLNAWEDELLARIAETRARETRDLFRMRLMAAVSIMLLWGMPAFISIASFGVYAVVLRERLTPAVVFTSVALFSLIQGPLRQITNIVILVIQSKVALERVSAFLAMPEVDTGSVLTIDSAVADSYIVQNVIISVEQASFSWGPEPDTEQGAVLRDVTWRVRAGELWVVQGAVGSGKSSLCAALLGEMTKRTGSVYVGGSVAFCSQQPWIQHRTLRDNVLFGLPMDRKKYNKVLDACALTADLACLPAGDLTEIGERGVNLSGGQKARLALARACYSDASIYLLDSPLSAVDAIVQNEIFHKCVLGLLSSKTVILVTHNPEILASRYVTNIATIDDRGHVAVKTKARPRHPDSIAPSPLTSPPSATGDAAPLVSPLPASQYTRAQFQVDELSLGAGDGPDDDEESVADEQAQEVPMVSPFRRDRVKSFLGESSGVSAEKARAQAGRLVEDEARADGRVHHRVFHAYYHALGGLPVAVLIVLPQLIGQGLQVSSDFWLGSWSSDGLSGSSLSTTTRLRVFAALGVAGALMVLVRMIVIAVFGVRAARRLFDRMTHALLHAPMRFFDANPIGRILTRYGGDVSAVDAALPFLLGRVAASLLSVGASTLTAAIVIQWNGLWLLPVAVLYVSLGAFYIRPARELQRLTRTAQAPVLNHLSEAVDGVTVVRAFGSWHVQRFRRINYDRLDEANKVRFAQLGVSQWFSLRIQLVGTALVMVVATSLVVLRDEISAAVIGLAFSYALKVSQSLETIVQLVSRVETAMISPERMQEYIDIPQEAASRRPGIDPPAHSEWPAHGAIEFRGVSFRYKVSSRLVLENLSFDISGGEKIVGGWLDFD